MQVRSYILAVEPFGTDVYALQRAVTSNPRISDYWNYLPHIYCLRSTAFSDELAKDFAPFTDQFFLAEIDLKNINGKLPPSAWAWFKSAPSMAAQLKHGAG